jgi:uncharacterized protein
MLCGIARLDFRSILATAIFFPVGIITFHLANPSLKTLACPEGVLCYEPVYPRVEDMGMIAALTVGFSAIFVASLLDLVCSAIESILRPAMPTNNS